MESKCVLQGFAIVVADKGFVYVGNVTYDSEMCVITNANNVRRWGTSKGLGELAINGPRDKTVLDYYGTVRVPKHAVISIIDTDENIWS